MCNRGASTARDCARSLRRRSSAKSKEATDSSAMMTQQSMALGGGGLGAVQVILASADSSLKAGIEHSLKTRIDSVVYYASVYDTVRRCGGWIL